MHTIFKIVDKDRKGNREQGAEGRRVESVVNEEYQVLLSIRRHTAKEVSGERIRSVKNMTSFQIGGRKGKTNANNVEFRQIEGEAEGVLVSCPLFYLQGGVELKIVSQKEDHGEASERAWPGCGTVLVGRKSMITDKVDKGHFTYTKLPSENSMSRKGAEM